MQAESLTPAAFVRASNALAAAHADFAAIVDAHGRAPFWHRDPGFPTLLHIVLEQQVSLASAQRVFDRLRQAVTPLTPERLLAAGDAALSGAGLTRQKRRTCLNLAAVLQRGELDLATLADADDERVRAALTAVVGIGPWTAEVYLLMALRRPDAWPTGDLALVKAIAALRRLPHRPAPAQILAYGEPLRPWRAVAARLLWHYYLCERGRRF